MKPLIPDGSLVFDIGANIGQSAQQFLAAGARRVISVEPCIENLLLLQRDERVTAIHAAAWSRTTFLEARFAYNSPGWSSVVPEKWVAAYPDAQWGKPQTVPTVTLDDLWKQFGRPALIKIDVEGVEVEVLSGLSSKSEFLIFEFHGKFVDDALKCLKICQELGFTRAHYVRENIDLDTIPTMAIDEFIPRFIDDAPEWGNITVT